MLDSFHSGWWYKVLSCKSKTSQRNKCIELINITILVVTQLELIVLPEQRQESLYKNTGKQKTQDINLQVRQQALY